MSRHLVSLPTCDRCGAQDRTTYCDGTVSYTLCDHCARILGMLNIAEAVLLMAEATGERKTLPLFPNYDDE